jgi:hypothetical protein
VCRELADQTYHPSEGARAMKNEITAMVDNAIKTDWLIPGTGLENGGTVTLRAPKEEESRVMPYELVYHDSDNSYGSGGNGAEDKENGKREENEREAGKEKSGDGRGEAPQLTQSRRAQALLIAQTTDDDDDDDFYYDDDDDYDNYDYDDNEYHSDDDYYYDDDDDDDYFNDEEDDYDLY